MHYDLLNKRRNNLILIETLLYILGIIVIEINFMQNYVKSKFQAPSLNFS
jgi:hypothetical protein